MKVYDISQEVFSCEVYPGDPIPEKNVLKSMQKGSKQILLLPLYSELHSNLNP